MKIANVHMFYTKDTRSGHNARIIIIMMKMYCDEHLYSVESRNILYFIISLLFLAKAVLF